MQNLLITFGSSSLAQRVGNLLKDRFAVNYATSAAVPAFMENRFSKIPEGFHPTFAHELLTLCLDQDMQFVLPLGRSEIQTLAETKQLFQEYGIALWCPDREELDELLVIDRPPAGADIRLFAEGKAVIGPAASRVRLNGLFAFSDSGEQAALCVV